MKVHEYQAKAVLAQYGVPTPKGRVAETADEAAAIAKEIGAPVASCIFGQKRSAARGLHDDRQNGIVVTVGDLII